MSTENKLFTLEDAQKSRKRFVRSLEYELIASLALQQYNRGGVPGFEQLLAIPLAARITGQLQEYGLKRMHRLIKLVLQEFCYALPLPKSRKLTDTQIAACACDLILVAEEDQLSLEDLVVFFEGAKAGRYGRVRGALTHYGIMQKLEDFRQLRHQAWLRLKEAAEAARKAEGPGTRTAPEPTVIKRLFEEGGTYIPLKKIS